MKLSQEILRKNGGRKIQKLDGTHWGELIYPASNENPQKNDEGLRVLGICSWTLGMLTFDALKHVEEKQPSRLNIVGLVTDDPVDRNAKITKKKRFWRYYDEERQEEYEEGIIESALSFGIPCYTGDVKNDSFRGLLSSWNPEIIIVAAFGQLIDKPIIEYPPYGIYNVHPADLLQHHGAGPQPWEDLVTREASTTRTAIHRVAEEIDSGHVVGESPLINVALKDGKLSNDVLLIGEKTLVPVNQMVTQLVLRVIGMKESGKIEPVDQIDFSKFFSDDFKKELLEPIDPCQRHHMLPQLTNETMFDV